MDIDDIRSILALLAFASFEIAILLSTYSKAAKAALTGILLTALHLVTTEK